MRANGSMDLGKMLMCSSFIGRKYLFVDFFSS